MRTSGGHQQTTSRGWGPQTAPSLPGGGAEPPPLTWGRRCVSAPLPGGATPGWRGSTRGDSAWAPSQPYTLNPALGCATVRCCKAPISAYPYRVSRYQPSTGLRPVPLIGGQRLVEKGANRGVLACCPPPPDTLDPHCPSQVHSPHAPSSPQVWSGQCQVGDQRRSSRSQPSLLPQPVQGAARRLPRGRRQGGSSRAGPTS
eukprot:SAG11_NODE_4226_length_2002_cov_1.188650_2_plen_201_part_00